MKIIILSMLLNLLVFGVAFGQISAAPTIINRPTVAATENPAADNPIDLVGLKGQAAPTFTLPSMNGTEYGLEKMRGKIVVINLWGTFCAPCIDEIPKLNALVKAYKDKDVIFLAPTPDDKTVLETFLQKYPFNYQVLPNGYNFVEKYAPHKKTADPQKKGEFLMILPTHLVIDQTGNVTYHEWGFNKDTIKKLSDEIERLLSNKQT